MTSGGYGPDLMDCVAAARGGDHDARERVVAAVLPELRACVRLNTGRLIRDHESESDIVQSVCRELIEDLHQFAGNAEGQFKRWLFSLALNKIRMRHRFLTAQRRDVRREVAPERSSTGDDPVLHSYASFCTPSQHVMAHEEIARIESAVDQLSDEQRQVLTLACIVGLSHQEIAAELGKAETAVRKTLSRARAQLGLLLALEE